jgi:hypothetical protein
VSRGPGVAALAALLLPLAPGAARAQVADTTAADSIPPSVLFDSEVPLAVRLAGDLRTLVNDRDSLKSKEHPFTLTVRDGDGQPVTLGVDLETRGHWRRQARNCDFPPLWLDLPRNRVAETVFRSQNRLKLVTPCRPGRRDYREYILREYAVYRIYNLLTPLSLRARLATTTYVDTTGRMDSLTVTTFLIEQVDEMARRNGGRRMDVIGARYADVDSLQFGLVGVFLYLIGATDWSLGGLHNMELMLDLRRSAFQPVAYDFDFSGIVNTSYARPDPRLNLRSVRDRRYRGTCLADGQWEAVLQRFRAHKAAIYAVYDSLPGLSPGYVRDTHRYLDDFYEVIDDPGKRASELVRRCSPEERV